ncbi:hypothetical protein D9M69_704530 [compost metagenome]
METSLIEVMKARMNAAMTPERTLGSRMVKKVFSGGEPRLMAASSIEKSNEANEAEMTLIT